MRAAAAPGGVALVSAVGFPTCSLGTLALDERQMKHSDALPNAIRAVEAEVLDRRHLDEPLLRRDQREALVYLQRSYAHTIRDHLHADPTDDHRWSDFITMLTLAFDQAVRWVTHHCSSRSVIADSVPDFSNLDVEADQLLGWATNYIKLCMDHTAASRRLYTASIDEEAKVISFAPQPQVDYAMLLAQLAAERVQENAQRGAVPDAPLSQLFHSWVADVDLSTIRVAADLPDILHGSRHHCYPAVKTWVDGQLLPELDESTSLGDFTVADLRKFWAHLYISTRMMTDLELAVDAKCGPINELGSVILEALTEDFYDMLAENWGLTRNATRGIVDLLTFNPNARRDGLNSSVFLKTAQGMTYLLAWKAQLSEPGTVSSRALARKSKRIYDALITKIEHRRVTEVATALEYSGLVSILGKKLEAAGVSIHPDFWLYEPLTSTLLACDYKHALPPFGPGDVSNRLNDIELWFDQIRKYTAFVTEHASYVGNTLGLPAIQSSEGLLVFRWALPIPAPSPDDIILADWPTLRSLVDQGIMIGVAELRRFFRNLRHASRRTSGKMVLTSYDIAVGDWTYRHPAIALDHAATNGADVARGA